MEHWEFLLQKNGDRSWLPLDSPSVEILEGRYRIVVRSSQPNTEVVVRISHLNPAADPPKRRLQKRSSRTNQDGLMVLIPYTLLEPGAWGFHCSSGDLMSELAGVPWQYDVQLQVLAQESEPEDWEPDWLDASEAISPEPQVGSPEIAPDRLSSPENLSESVSDSPLASVQLASIELISSPELTAPELAEASPVEDPTETVVAIPLNSLENSYPTLESDSRSGHVSTDQELRYLTEHLSEELINEVMQELDLLDLPEPFLRSGLDSEDSSGRLGNVAQFPDAVPLNQPVLRLKLDQDAFVARQSETLTLTGIIQGLASDRAAGTIPDPWDSVGKSPQPQPPARSLQLYLRDPQSLEVLVSDRLPLSAQTFSLDFSLPDFLDTRLLLGEVQLCAPRHEDTSQVLASQTFTVTVNPLELVQELTRINTALTQPKSEVDRFPQPSQEQSVSLDLSFLASAASLPDSPLKSSSGGGQPLPPQLYQPDLSRPRTSRLHLPNFTPPLEPTQTEQPEQTPDAVAPKLEAGMPVEMSSIAGSPTIAVDSSEFEKQPETNSVLLPSQENDLAESIPIEMIETLEELPLREASDSSSEAVAVENLAFQSLNIHDRFLTRLNALAGESEPVPQENALTWVSPVSLSEESERMADEVVNDEFSTRSRSRSKLNPTISEAVGNSSEQPNPLILSPDETVPTPELQVTSGELVAGKPVNIRVRLPNLLPRIYVKLWINDRQTRSLLEGPRWLVDLLPNGHGALEMTTQLLVPLGSLDIRIEAIAVEVQTQRESRKATIDRAVVPANLPALSLQDSLSELGD